MTPDDRRFAIAIVIPVLVCLFASILGCGQRTVAFPRPTQVSAETSPQQGVTHRNSTPATYADARPILDQSNWDETEWLRCAWQFIHVDICYPKHFWDSAII